MTESDLQSFNLVELAQAISQGNKPLAAQLSVMADRISSLNSGLGRHGLNEVAISIAALDSRIDGLDDTLIDFGMEDIDLEDVFNDITGPLRRIADALERYEPPRQIYQIDCVGADPDRNTYTRVPAIVEINSTGANSVKCSRLREGSCYSKKVNNLGHCPYR